jgi:arginyl-tRNA synthetase
VFFWKVVQRPAGAAESLQAWRALCAVSRAEFQKLYDELGVEVTERGESFYNPLLGEVLERLEREGLLEESGGAMCVFPAEGAGGEGAAGAGAGGKGAGGGGGGGKGGKGKGGGGGASAGGREQEREQEREQDARPLLVQKQDGGFLYATTDLAALMHRTRPREGGAGAGGGGAFAEGEAHSLVGAHSLVVAL